MSAQINLIFISYYFKFLMTDFLLKTFDSSLNYSNSGDAQETQSYKSILVLALGD